MNLPRVDTEYLRTFNREQVRADFSYWLPFDSWSTDQAVCLSLNRDPRKVQWMEHVFSYTEISRVAKEFERRLAMIDAAQAVNRLRDPIQPESFCRWCVEKNLRIPPEMVAATNSVAQPLEEKQFKISEVISCLERVRRSDAHEFREFAKKEKLSKGASPSSWQRFADWYCFKFNAELLGRTDTDPSKVIDIVLNTDASQDWVDEARRLATSIVQEAITTGNRRPTQSEVASLIKAKLAEAKIKTSKRKDIGAPYIIRMALSKGAWWTEKIKNL